MKNFDNYNLEDILLDDEFRRIVWESENGNNELWQDMILANPDNDALLHQARELVMALGKKTSLLSRQEITAGVARIMLDCEEEKSVFKLNLRMSWLTIAASILIVLGAGFGVLYKSKTSIPEYVHQQGASFVSSPLTEIVNESENQKLVNLPDGSTIMLSPASKISYAIPFIQNKHREIFLSGEAFFEIHKDTVNPLFVYANGLITKVIGTSFLIKTTENDVKVLVRTGRVSVMPLSDVKTQTKRKTELLLTPNQLALFSKKDNVISKTVSASPVELVNAGSDPLFTFENQPIDKVFKTLERVYGIPIIYDSTTMAKCFLHVELSNEPFFTKLDIISKTVRASYKINDGKVIVSGKGCN